MLWLLSLGIFDKAYANATAGSTDEHMYVAPDHWVDQAMSCVTVFGGTGFLGRRVVQKLCESGATVRTASRHPGRAEDDNVKQIAADAHDERSVEAAVAGADGVVNEISLYVQDGSARSTGQCNTACSLSAGVWKPKVFRGR